MSQPPFLSLPPDARVDIFNQISTNTGMPAFAVEKDWWVVQTLANVFVTTAAPALVFKGGTSLSKAWGLIQRFSEDIDLVIDRVFFGYDGDLSGNQRKNLRIEAGKYAEEKFLAELKQWFAGNDIDLNGIHIVDGDSDQDPRIIHVYYPNLIAPPGYMEPRVSIEIGTRSLMEPHTQRSFGSLVDEQYKEAPFAQPFINIPAVNPERTFLEKIFLLHEEFKRPSEKMRFKRLSRHLYDIVKLCKTDVMDKALNDQGLYATIVEHRYKFTRVGEIDYHLHQPQAINPIPPAEVLEAWKDDYQTMTEQMFYDEEPPTFKEIIEQMKVVTKRINDLPWTIEMPYLDPK